MSNVFEIETRALPVLALRGLNIFPGMLLNFDVERPISVAALNSAMDTDQELFLVTQKDVTTDLPDEGDLYKVGVVCRIRQLIRQPGSKLCKVMVEGLQRGRIVQITAASPHFVGEIQLLPDKREHSDSARRDALMRTCIGMFDEYVQLAGNMPPEMLLSIVVSRDPGYVADYIAHNLRIDYREKQQLLEQLHPLKRLEMLVETLSHEIEVMTIEQEINDATNEQMNRNQREYFLREQIALIYTANTEVVALVKVFLLYAIAWQTGDAIAAPIQGILRGYKDVDATFWASMLAYWGICLPLGLFLDYKVGNGAFAYWQSLDCGVLSSATLLSIRLIWLQRKIG